MTQNNFKVSKLKERGEHLNETSVLWWNKFKVNLSLSNLLLSEKKKTLKLGKKFF